MSHISNKIFVLYSPCWRSIHHHHVHHGPDVSSAGTLAGHHHHLHGVEATAVPLPTTPCLATLMGQYVYHANLRMDQTVYHASPRDQTVYRANLTDQIVSHANLTRDQSQRNGSDMWDVDWCWCSCTVELGLGQIWSCICSYFVHLFADLLKI